MDLVRKYESLARLERWPEALSVIEAITEQAPEIATSWFNYGVCLDQLDRHSEAAEKFRRAYELDPDDFGAQYRTFRSLFLSGDYDRFREFAERECEAIPGLIENLLADEQFAPLFERREFAALKDLSRKHTD